MYRGMDTEINRLREPFVVTLRGVARTLCRVLKGEVISGEEKIHSLSRQIKKRNRFEEKF